MYADHKPNIRLIIMWHISWLATPTNDRSLWSERNAVAVLLFRFTFAKNKLPVMGVDPKLRLENREKNVYIDLLLHRKIRNLLFSW